jgi:hypothetical protein
MLKRIAPISIAAAVLMLANGCCCTQPHMCGDVAVCDSCDGGGCGSCGCAVGCCPGRPLAGCLTRALTCGSGCGDVYWDEWINDPPACCDPCDDYGNWTGNAYCPPRCRPLSGLGHLWGYRYAPAGCDEACGSYVDTMPEFLDSQVGPEQELVPPEPDNAPTPARKASARRRVRHATYNRTLLE